MLNVTIQNDGKIKIQSECSNTKEMRSNVNLLLAIVSSMEIEKVMNTESAISYQYGQTRIANYLQLKKSMTTNLCEKPDNHGAGWVIAVVIITMLLFVTAKCQAQQKAAIDTMVCKVECIKQIVQKPSINGKTVKYMAVYVDKSAGFSEIIPISKSVVDYIGTCKQFSIEPTLGIRLRNGVITSIVRYKIKFVHK